MDNPMILHSTGHYVQCIRRTAGAILALVLLASTAILPATARKTFVPEPKAVVKYENSAPQSILDGAQVTPVSTITIPDSLKGYVVDVDVKLRALEHQSPDDLAVMLVGPRGQAIVVMGDAGNADTIVNTYLTFDDEAATQLPNPGTILSGTYKPSDFLAPTNAIFTSGAPAPNIVDLSGYDNTDPRGTWSLYILDDTVNSADGQLVYGWELILTTTNTKPHAKNEKYHTEVNVQLDVKAKDGLLKNATDADGKDTIRIDSRGKMKNDKGSIKIFRDGAFKFRPKKNVSGKATFTYTIIDNGGKTDSAKAIIYIDNHQK